MAASRENAADLIGRVVLLHDLSQFQAGGWANELCVIVLAHMGGKFTVTRTARRGGLRDGVRRAEFVFADEETAFCAVCGCSMDEPCPGGCYWADDPKRPGTDVCNRCVGLTHRDLINELKAAAAD